MIIIVRETENDYKKKICNNRILFVGDEGVAT